MELTGATDSAIPVGKIVGILASFGVCLWIFLGFSVYYVKKYSNPLDSFWGTTLTSILSMIVALITCSMLPIDIFIVSSMKFANGTFVSWAAEVANREHFESQVQLSYFALYSLIFFFIFALIPFMYFYTQEKVDSELFETNQFCSALKYTLIFIFLAAFFLALGALVPLRELPNNNSTNTDNASWIDKFEDLIHSLENGRGEDAISMVLSILTSLGVISLVFYTGVGLFSWPIGFIKGTKSARNQMLDIEDRHFNNTFNINSLREKQRTHGNLTERELARLRRLEEQERRNTAEESLLSTYQSTIFYQCRYFTRPIQIVFGVMVLLVSILLWVSLLITNIDKAVHSLGMHYGYALPNSTYPNPADFILTELSIFYPLDHVLIIIFTFMLVMFTISGYTSLGIRCFCIRIFKIVPGRTSPQTILMLFWLLMTSILGINILFYSTFPQYATFGNQHYVDPKHNSTIVRCGYQAPPEACTMTRASALLVRFFYKAWFFGAFYYYAMWAFLGISLFAFFYILLKPKESITDALLDDADDLEDDN